MTREQFEHVIRAVAEIVNDEIVVVGSQAILAEHPNAPAELLVSMEADVYPRHSPERAIEIDGALGDGSRFHETYGYYAHGVGPETAVAPAGWQERLIRLEVPATRPRDATVTVWCLEAHDLVLAKLAAGREHDLDFAEGALRAGLVDREQLRLGVGLIVESHREVTRRRLESVVARSHESP